MDSKITVFLIVMLLAVLRGLMQRSQVRKEIEARVPRGSRLAKKRITNRTEPAVDPAGEVAEPIPNSCDDDAEGSTKG